MQAAQQQPGAPDSFSAFPAPPEFYRLYAAGPDAGPPPPQPVSGEIHALGEAFNTDEPLAPPLDVPRLYSVEPDGSVDVKAELRKLNKGLLFLFLELLAVLVGSPSQYAGTVSQLLVTLHNMAHLLNLVRVPQARETLKCSLAAQIADKQAALTAMRERTARARQDVLRLTQQLAAAGDDTAESKPAAGAAAMDEG